MSATVLCQAKSCLKGYPPSRPECPTCSKLGIRRGSLFCGQETFRLRAQETNYASNVHVISREYSLHTRAARLFLDAYRT
ncbi:hypothetical protein CPB85DRAFT_1289051 [Mucidula mucida]|nr:hypothetical protein CPB85DRAFT_1289051 [Mucidula mucida]